MSVGWLSSEDCPDCGGPLLETSTDNICGGRFLSLNCPGCGYHARVLTTDPEPGPDPDLEPDETEAE